MRLPWLRATQVKTKVYVPVSDGMTEPYEERWNSIPYLQMVIDMTKTQAFRSETLHGLALMRDVADKATTPEQLLGANKCIKVMKSLITAGSHASNAIKMIKLSKEEVEDGFPSR